MRRFAWLFLSFTILYAVVLQEKPLRDKDGQIMDGRIRATVFVYESPESGLPFWSGTTEGGLPSLNLAGGYIHNMADILPGYVKKSGEIWIDILIDGEILTEERIKYIDSANLSTGEGLRREIIPEEGSDIAEDMDLDLNIGETGGIAHVVSDMGIGTATPESKLDVEGDMRLSAGVPVDKILDEDDMASNDPSALATQQSIKAYVDSAGGGVSEAVLSVSSEANRRGRYGHMMFVPSEGTEITESDPAFNDTIYIAMKSTGGSDTCTAAPAAPSSIDGVSTACSGAPGTSYGIPPVRNATYYRWTVPDGSTIISGFGTNIIHTYLGNTDGNICVEAVNDCGSSSAVCKAVTINRPTAPGSISGPTLICEDTVGISYGIAAVPEATSYSWTLPPGAVIASGAGTPAITINFGTSGGSLCVRTENSCGLSDPSCITISTTRTPSTPGSITGSSSLCEYGSATFSISSVADATSYSWTVPAGATITSGATSTSIDVTFGDAGGNVCASAVSICGTSSPSCKPVTIINPPAEPDTIYGNLVIIPGTTGESYTIDAVAGANSNGYVWTVFSGPATIVGSPTGTSATLDFSSTPGMVNLCVTASNGCGVSDTSCIQIVNAAPSGSVTFNYTGTIESWTVPAYVTSIEVECLGAEGGDGGASCTYGEIPGRGARMVATIPVTPGDEFRILVGQQGFTPVNYGGGGGGGTFFVHYSGGTYTPYLIAGGGAGCGYNDNLCDERPGTTAQNGTGGNPNGASGGTGGNGGNAGTHASWSAAGGGGFYTNGANSTSTGSSTNATGGRSFLAGGGGGNGTSTSHGANGGFGGGGGSDVSGGGGGGYSGGAGGGYSGTPTYTGGGGGGSYVIGTASLTASSSGFQSGNGQININW